jgi:hypothetical protein
MSNIATALKEEILRLARKEIRRQTNTLKKASAPACGMMIWPN